MSEMPCGDEPEEIGSDDEGGYDPWEDTYDGSEGSS